MANTSAMAFRELDTLAKQARVEALVKGAGEHGLIWEDIRAAIPGADGGLSPRITELCNMGTLCRNGDTRRAVSTGRLQQVIRDAQFAVAKPPEDAPKPGRIKDKFVSWLRKKLDNFTDLADAKAYLDGELGKQLKGS